MITALGGHRTFSVEYLVAFPVDNYLLSFQVVTSLLRVGLTLPFDLKVELSIVCIY